MLQTQGEKLVLQGVPAQRDFATEQAPAVGVPRREGGDFRACSVTEHVAAAELAPRMQQMSNQKALGTPWVNLYFSRVFPEMVVWAPPPDCLAPWDVVI